jgi:hypothetical protein
VLEKKEQWQDLCEQAAVEQDSDKLLELTKEINRLLLGMLRAILARTDPTAMAQERSSDQPLKVMSGSA